MVYAADARFDFKAASGKLCRTGTASQASQWKWTRSTLPCAEMAANRRVLIRQLRDAVEVAKPAAVSQPKVLSPAS